METSLVLIGHFCLLRSALGPAYTGLRFSHCCASEWYGHCGRPIAILQAVKWNRTSKMDEVLNPWRKVCWDALHNTAAGLGFGIASYRQPERLPAFAAVRRAKHNREMLLTPLEAAELSSLVRATAKLEGSMAEVGVFRGASAGLMHDTDPHRALHLFDTFEGLPEPAETDTEFRNGQFMKGQFACALDEVKDYLGSCGSIFFHKGLFPDSAESIKEEHFSFVHADVDLYASTRSVLEFFYPRLVPGGVILSHDFHSCQGPHRAISEFFDNKPEPIIELPGDQAVIVKV